MHEGVGTREKETDREFLESWSWSWSPCVLADVLSGLGIMGFLGTRHSEYIHTDNVGTHLVIIRNVHTAWVVCSLTTRVGTQPLEAFKE